MIGVKTVGWWFVVILYMCGIMTHIYLVKSEVDTDESWEDGIIENEDYESEVSEKPSMNIKFADDVDDPNIEVFKPTTEWQTVKPGQSVPKGLHIRFNLQSGKTEAMLLDEEENDNTAEAGTSVQETSPQVVPESLSGEPDRLQRMKESIEQAMKDMEGSTSAQETNQDGLKYWKQGDKEGMLHKKKDFFTRDELKEALKKFKTTRNDVADKVDPERFKKFRSMDKIKADMKKLNLDMKTDLEILREILETYKKQDLTDDERQRVLTDIEYYVHQIDNANNFANMGGLEFVMKDLNHTNENIRSEAAFVLGSAVQSNPKMQVETLKTGAMQPLIRMLLSEPSARVRQRVLYAVSALIRNFPYAQKNFLQLGGLHTLTDLFAQPETRKLQVKAVTLVSDLLTEKEDVEKDFDPEDSIQQERRKQYKEVQLLEALLEQGWCQLVPSLLTDSDHDTREKVLGAMNMLMLHCRNYFQEASQSLASLKTEYEQLALEEKEESSDDMYYSKLLHTVNSMIDDLSITKDEL